MIERALELARKRAQAAEVTLTRRRSTAAEYEDDRLKHVSVAETSHLRVRVIVDGKLGSAQTTDPQDAEGAVARAVELAEFGAEVNFEFPGPGAAPAVRIHDAEVEKTTKDDLVAAGAEMLELIKAYNPEIKVSGDAGWSVGEWRLVNSSGLDVSERGSSFSLGAAGVLVRGTDVLFAGHGRGWRRKEFAPREIAERAIEKFRLAERTAKVESGTMPIILTPPGNYLLLSCLLPGVNGKNALKKDSPLAGRLGERLAPHIFSLADDGTVDYAPASSAYDGEGVPRRRTEIISQGVLGSFLYDLETAGKAALRQAQDRPRGRVGRPEPSRGAGTASTGNGPGCGPSNIIIAPGEATLAEMVKGTREGLLVDGLMGLGQSNIMNGDFSVNVSLGYQIEHGELVGRVKDTMLAGNVYDALKRIEAIGSEAEWTAFFCAPPIKIGALSVVAKG